MGHLIRYHTEATNASGSISTARFHDIDHSHTGTDLYESRVQVLRHWLVQCAPFSCIMFVLYDTTHVLCIAGGAIAIGRHSIARLASTIVFCMCMSILQVTTWLGRRMLQNLLNSRRHLKWRQTSLQATQLCMPIMRTALLVTITLPLFGYEAAEPVHDPMRSVGANNFATENKLHTQQINHVCSCRCCVPLSVHCVKTDSILHCVKTRRHMHDYRAKCSRPTSGSRRHEATLRLLSNTFQATHVYLRIRCQLNIRLYRWLPIYVCIKKHLASPFFTCCHAR
jgi:membrane protein implicated in regulation of membrane protease activity